MSRPCTTNAWIVGAVSIELVIHQWSKPVLPDPDRLVADLESETELVSQTPENCHEDDVCRKCRSLNGVPVRLLNRRLQDLK